MSYILDALKRAEAERDRGAVPTLNTQGPGSAGAARSNGSLLYVLIGVGLLVVVLLGLLVWRSGSAPEPQPPQIAQQAPSLPVPAQAPPQQQQQRRTAPPPPAVVHKLAPPPVAAQPAVPAPVAAPASAPVPGMAELPDGVRRSLPQLKFGGAMYSDAPASRVLILNGQLLHEGESVQPGLVIETIGVHKATLSQNGQRFTIDY